MRIFPNSLFFQILHYEIDRISILITLVSFSNPCYNLIITSQTTFLTKEIRVKWMIL